MQLGVVFPQAGVGTDPGAIREYVQAAEDLGYSHLIAFDHVLGIDPEFHKDLGRPFTLEDLYHEVFVLFGYIAAVSERIELVTGVVILGQRQTALVAKQSAEVDILSKGRLRLGVGTGRSYVEYEGLGENFHNRGRRSEEQIALMRALWTNQVVDFEGRWHKVHRAGINPLPVQRPIPIWLGGAADAVLRRVAKIGDGWYYRPHSNLDARAALDVVRRHLEEEGRDPRSFGIQVAMRLADHAPDTWAQRVGEWQELGATHLALNTLDAGLESLDAHIDAIRQFKEAVGPSAFEPTSSKIG